MSASRKALGLGAVSGLRLMAGPALLSRAAAKGLIPLEGTALAFLGSPRVSKALLVAGLGELVGDKLPMTPSRTSLPPLIGRAASGALVGAALFASADRRAPPARRWEHSRRPRRPSPGNVCARSPVRRLVYRTP